MRQIDHIPHPRLKVSVFEWEGKWIVKVEQYALEQIFKFKKEPPFEQWNALKPRLDATFLEEAERLLEGMARLRNTRYPARNEEPEWPKIV